MNKYQKEVLQSQLNDEKHTIKLLQRVYEQARTDCEKRISQLSARKDLENLQSIIYQKEYQEALKKQLDGIINILQGEEFDTISEYLQKCYESGYTGVMYDLQHQGIPITVPIDQKQVTKAIQLDSKLSEGLYKRLGEDTQHLKRSIRAELSRGITQGKSWNEIATHIARGMNSPFNRGINNAIRIARTEGHRIQEEAGYNAQKTAKSKGADIVKQWCSTLDSRTRDSHQKLDGKIKELNERFTINGHKALYPGNFGDPAEDCNCRCTLLQRAKWALGEKELEELKKRAEYYGLDKTKNFEDYKKKYLQVKDVKDYEKEFEQLTDGYYTYDEFIKEFETIEDGFDGADPADIKRAKELAEKIKQLRGLNKKEHVTSEGFKKLDEILGKKNKVKHIKVEDLQKPLSEREIIDKIGGGDLTNGSCSSLSLAYMGNKAGWDVTDYRGGISQECFADGQYLSYLYELDNVKVIKHTLKKEASDGFKFLQSDEVKQNVEYRLTIGKHAAIIKKNSDNTLEYLELQSEHDNGWYELNLNELINRFGARKTVRRFHGRTVDSSMTLMEVDSIRGNDEFKSLLGYLNTSPSKQKKGVGGHVR